MTNRVAFVLLVVFALPALSAEKPHAWETAKVISQELNSSRAGTYVGPLGGGSIAAPLYRRTNHVILETATYRFGLDEVGRSPLILAVNDDVMFYRDGKWFIMLDAEGKKHKFGLTGMVKKDE